MRKFAYKCTVCFKDGVVLETIRFKKQTIKNQHPTAVKIAIKTIVNETGYDSFHKYRNDTKKTFNKQWRKAMKQQ